MRPPTSAGVGPSKRLFSSQYLGGYRTLADALGGLLAGLNRPLRWFIEHVRGRFDGEELCSMPSWSSSATGSAAANPPMAPGCTPD
ncbi:hypothetical protein [Streptomyces sp. NPDC059278]|uniref:hypothetical protein n=1 Tax=Streptomyces sp. NPDC059278 TaxID=3346801 RepID=UPI00368E0124